MSSSQRQTNQASGWASLLKIEGDGASSCEWGCKEDVEICPNKALGAQVDESIG